MPRVHTTPTTFEATQRYDRPEGLPKPVFARNGIGVVALASINGPGAHGAYVRAAARRLAKKNKISVRAATRQAKRVARRMPGRPTSKAVAAEVTYMARRKAEGKHPAPLGSGERFAHVVRGIMRSTGMSETQARAVAAAQGRKTYGKGYFQSLAARGQKRARGMRPNTHKESAMLKNKKTRTRRRGKSKGSPAARTAMKLAAKHGMSLKQAWGLVKGHKKGASRGKARSKARGKGKSPLRHFVARGKKTRQFRYGRTVGASKMTIRGRGTVVMKGGKRSVKGKFRKGVVASVQGGRLRVFAANRGKKGASKSRYQKMRAHYAKKPPSAEEMQTAIEQMRGMPAAERLRKAYRYLGTAPTYRTVTKKERVIASTGGYKIRRGRGGRPTFGKGKHHIQEWQFVGAPSAAYYAAFPDDNGFGDMRAIRASMRQKRAAELSNQAQRYAGLASTVEKEGDMYAPNKRRRGRKASKRRLHGSARRAYKRKIVKGRRAKRAGRKARRYGKRGGVVLMLRGRRGKARRAGKRHAKRGVKRGWKRSVKRAGKRGSRRGFRRNGFRRNGYEGMIKQGLLGLAGLIAHKVAKNVLVSFVFSKVGALSTGTLAPYQGLLASLAAAAGGIPLVNKFVPADQKTAVVTGMAASLFQDVLSALLAFAKQPVVAGYLAGIPSRSITDYRAVGDYYSPLQGFGAYPEQAAAGFGVAPYAQAAAGFGASPYAQAAVGYGLAEYEPMSGVTLDGIHGDQMSAERALNAADYPMQAAAGIGGIPSKNIWIPDGPETAVHGLGIAQTQGEETDSDPALSDKYSTGVFSGQGDGIFQATTF